MPILHEYCGLNKVAGRVINDESELFSYDEAAILRATTVLITTLSFVVPILAILVLHVVKDTYVRSGVAAAVLAIFLACMPFGRRVEILAAAAV